MLARHPATNPRGRNKNQEDATTLESREREVLESNIKPHGKRRRQTGKEKIGDHTELENANGKYQEEIDKKQLEERKPVDLE